jgi:choice-of-anchor C domain-containing protein
VFRRIVPLTLAAVAGSALVAAPVFAATSLVTNGDFETPVISGAFLQTSTLSGWTVVSGDVDIVRSYWTPAQGDQSIDLWGCAANGIIRQALTTSGSTAYNLSFFLAGNPVEGGVNTAGPRTGVVRVGTTPGGADLVTQNLTFNTSGKSLTNMGWITQSINFAASSGTTYLEFEDTSNAPGQPCQGIALDDIRVEVANSEVVPQVPAIFAIAGMVGMAALLVLGGRSLRRPIAV